MNLKRIGLAIGATAVTGAALYAGNEYFGGDGSGTGPTELSEPAQLVEEAINTNCGLGTTGGAAADGSTGKSGVVSASVTRARVTVSGEVDDTVDITKAIEAGDCRFRLDGVWVEDLPLSLDENVTIDGFTSQGGGSLDPALLHSTFVTPRTLLIEASEDSSELTIRNGVDPSNAMTAKASDDTPMSAVFSAERPRKTYRNSGGSSQIIAMDDAGDISVDVTRTGRVRIRIGGTNYFRPTTNAFGDAETKSNNPWMIERNLDNLDASLKGYDAYAQDAFELNRNPKAAVFEAADPEAYTVTEKRTVPLGLKLVAEGAQGSVMNSEMIRTERQYQKTVTTSFGANIGFEGGAAAAGVGADYTESMTKGMREANARSITTGNARHKIYALVLDQPFMRLSDAFVDAVEDARRYGRYDELIERFGTHYPYAVTYGSSALMYAEFEESQINQWQAESQDVNVNAGLAIKGFGASFSAGRFEENREENSLLETTEHKDFKAVGGTGSFNQDNFGSGTPYPILADLRPLYQLLNPLNFPGEKEVYTKVREELRKASEAYLAQFGQNLRDTMPRVEQTYLVTPKKLACVSGANGLPKGLEINPRHLIDGRMKLKVTQGQNMIGSPSAAFGPWENLKINCWGKRNRSVNLATGTMRITGTYDEITRSRLGWEMSLWSERVTLIRKRRSYAQGTGWPMALPTTLKVGESTSINTVIRKKTDDHPELVITSEVRRTQ